jgi:hypothetical protein
VVREGRFYRTYIPISDKSIVINRDIVLDISVPISLFSICSFFTLDIWVWTWSPVLNFDIAIFDIPRPICRSYKWTYRKWGYRSIAMSGDIGFRYVNFWYVHSYKLTYRKWVYWKPVVARGIRKPYIQTYMPIFR